VIHFSTDCVFNGKRGCYTEDDSSDAEDLYGRSKYLGEVAADNALTLRTSVIGRELSQFRSLLEWFLAQNGKTIRGFRRVIYSGVTTNYLARRVGDLIAGHPSLSGLYQVTSAPICKYDLLCLLREAFKLDVEIVPDENEVSDRSMAGDAFLRDTGYQSPDWPGLIAELVNDTTPYEKWR
jgi:dTDP-4-dehydrorhamnose reductase